MTTLAVWRANFGNTLSGSGSEVNTAEGLAAVPEPSSLVLLLLPIAPLLGRALR